MCSFGAAFGGSWAPYSLCMSLPCADMHSRIMHSAVHIKLLDHGIKTHPKWCPVSFIDRTVRVCSV